MRIGMRAAVVLTSMAGSGLMLACANPPPTDPFTRVDSAGVEIVHSREPAWGTGEGWLVGGTLLEIGSEDDPLFDVVGALRRPGGGVAAGLGSSGEIRFYGPGGALEASLGGSGEGPGEFRILQAIGALLGDTVWAYDFSLARMTLLHPTDGIVGIVSLDSPIGRGLAVGPLREGGWVLREAWGEAAGRLEPGLRRDPVRVARIGFDGVLLDTLASIPGREILLTDEGGRTVMGTAPFARDATVAIAGDEVLVGDQEGYEFRVLSPAGDVVRSVRWEGPDPAVTAEDVHRWKEAQLATADPRDRPGLRTYLETVPVPPSRPAYGPILPAPEGGWWVGGYADPGRAPGRWDVFDGQGRWLGAVAMPDGFTPLEIGAGWIVGREVDELGVERVTVRSLGSAGRDSSRAGPASGDPPAG